MKVRIRKIESLIDPDDVRNYFAIEINYGGTGAYNHEYQITGTGLFSSVSEARQYIREKTSYWKEYLITRLLGETL